MKILIGCEKSGRVRDAFIRAGHEATSCDLEPSDSNLGPHILDDVRNALHYRKWDAGIFFPPCTYLCSSGLHWNNRGRGWEETEKALALVRDLLNAKLKNVRVENPKGCISTRLYFNGNLWAIAPREKAKPKSRPSLQSIQPYQFGDDASKETLIFGKGEWPHLAPTRFVHPRYVCGSCGVLNVPLSPSIQVHFCPSCGLKAKPRWANQTDSGQNRLGPSEDRAELRGKTYQGIASAMANQWK